MSDASPPCSGSGIEALVEQTFRAEAGRVHATLVATLGDLERAEDAVQEAFAEALLRWPTQGIPDRPGAWLTTAARRRAIDRDRRERRRPRLEEAAVRHRPPPEEAPELIADDQLRLVFTCCHPALAPEAQVALTLRLVCGLATAEVARLFLVGEATMAQRLVRAKAKVRVAAIPFRLPPADLLPERLDSVLRCAYLVFTSGYAPSSGTAPVDELCDEGVRLARTLVALMPDEPEVRGLLALLLLQDSRRDARVDVDGRPVPLELQDRTRWDRRRIDEGLAELARAARSGRPGPLRLQAAVAAEHARSSSWEATDWHAVAAGYAALARRSPSPVVEVARAVAVGHAEGPDAGLAVLAEVADDPRLARSHAPPAAEAHLLILAGRPDAAAAALERALALDPPDADRHLLEHRLATLPPARSCGS